MLDLTRKYHSTQTRNKGRVPYWHHCDNVAHLLEMAFAESGEGSAKTREAVVLAACGHDLYEDTTIESKEILEKLGTELGEMVDKLIDEVTNRFGDNNVDKYATEIKESSESARLIKLADLFDNATSCAYGIADNGVEWTRDFLLPILTKQWNVLRSSEFVAFSNTAKILKTLGKFAMRNLQTSIERT